MAITPKPIVSLKELRANPPLVHGPEGSNELDTRGLLPSALEWIESNVDPETR